MVLILKSGVEIVTNYQWTNVPKTSREQERIIYEMFNQQTSSSIAGCLLCRALEIDTFCSTICETNRHIWSDPCTLYCIQFRPGPLEDALEKRGATNNAEASVVVQRDIDRYYQLLQVALASVNLRDNEFELIAEAGQHKSTTPILPRC